MKFLALLCLLSLSTVSFAATLVNGAGATFPYPLYSKWFSEYQKVDKDSQFNYQSIGSGGGIRQFSEKTVDFGATDAPMTEEQMKKAAAPVLHIPTVLGAVVVTYNLPAAGAGLKLTGEIIADIFLGKITSWGDPRIAKLNPGKTLTGDVMVVHRSDGSGTTNIFTDYLAKVSADWKTKAGTGQAVSWPVGLGGKGNEGVAGLIKQTPGTIGYVELIYAKSNGLPYASIQNKAGQFIEPNMDSVAAAADGFMKDMPADYRLSITNADGKKSYPLSAFTYLLVWKSMPDAKGEKIVKFLKWATTEGQKMAASLHYAPLPKAMLKKVEATIGSIDTKKMP